MTAILALLLHQITLAAVSCTNNSWQVSSEANLNDAITCYNAKAIPNEYAITLTQNISLTASANSISNANSHVTLLIDGAGFTIDGQDTWDVRPFTINTNTIVAMQNITITGGKIFMYGGGIQNQGDLTLDNSVIADNYSERFGGGIHNTHVITINDSILRDNTARDYFGGGVYNQNGTTIINNSLIQKNSAEWSGVVLITVWARLL